MAATSAAGSAPGLLGDDHRSGTGRPERRADAQARGHPVHGDREERRRRRHVERDALSGSAGGHPEPRLHPHLRRPLPVFEPVLRLGREPALLRLGRRHVRAPRRHRLQHGGPCADVGRGIVHLGDRDRGARGAKPPAFECRGHGHGLPEPAADPRDRGRGELPGPVVAHGSLARGHGPRGQARRRRGYRLHGLSADPGARPGERARGRVPAAAAVAVRGAGLPLAVPAGGGVARPQLPVLHELHAPADARHREGVLAPDGDRSGLRRSPHRQPAQQDDARGVARVPRGKARRPPGSPRDDDARRTRRGRRAR